MTDETFWNKVLLGTKKLNISNATFRKWKSRGRVSRDRLVDIYQVLEFTSNAVSLDELNMDRSNGQNQQVAS